MELFIIIPIHLILCLCVGAMWHGKGRSYGGGFWLSFFFSPIVGFIVGICLAPARRT